MVVIFIIILLMAFVSGHSLTTDDDRINTINTLKQSSAQWLLHAVNVKTDLATFQIDLLRKRNTGCGGSLLLTNQLDWLNGTSQLVDIFNQKCLNVSLLNTILHVSSYDALENLRHLTDIVLIQFYNEGCNFCPIEKTDEPSTEPLKRLHAWLFGLTSVSVIVLFSFGGAFLYPLAQKRAYKKVLMFLISLAIGTLTGTSFLHLIPQAFAIEDDDQYLWIALTIFGGVYLFFLVEQILKFFMQFRKHRKMKKMAKKAATAKPYHHHNEESHAHSHHHLTSSKEILVKAIAPVAWIIICSESLHNFIDGLSIGAAYSESLLKGLSLSLAIVCEEFPHKLGDFAILLSAGMTFKIALLCNFLASILIYGGVVLGILFGEDHRTNQWIYAIAGGMFLYIAICDMMPELNDMAVDIEKDELTAFYKHKGTNKPPNLALVIKIKLKNFLIQNMGILVGFILMLLLAVYSKKIEL